MFKLEQLGLVFEKVQLVNLQNKRFFLLFNEFIGAPSVYRGQNWSQFKHAAFVNSKIFFKFNQNTITFIRIKPNNVFTTDGAKLQD